MAVLATNKKAYHNYYILERCEAGIVLSGNEVKSVRNKRMNLRDSYVKIKDNEVFLINAHLPPYQKPPPNFDPYRSRKLLLTKAQLRQLKSKVAQSNLTIVALRVYTKGKYIKVEIALAKGKKKFEKRREEKKAEVKRQIEEELVFSV